MRKLLLVFALVLIIAVSGCTQTGQVIGPENKTTGNQSEALAEQNQSGVFTRQEGTNATLVTVPAGNQSQQADACEGVTCSASFKECPDGFLMSCNNTCVDGECTDCEPSCEEHGICNIVDCSNSTTCPDLTVATCYGDCDPETGACEPCTPSCEGHTGCVETWMCYSWGPCRDGYQSRACIDENNCTTTFNKPVINQSCTQPFTDHILFSEVYYDAYGNDYDNEWIELYNPTNRTIDVSGYSLLDNSADSKKYYIPNGTAINSEEYLVVARKAAGFTALYGCSPDIDGWTFTLSNTGDVLYLREPDGGEVDFVAWEGGMVDWNINASTNNSIVRSPVYEDSDTAWDWLSDQVPSPANCF